MNVVPIIDARKARVEAYANLMVGRAGGITCVDAIGLSMNHPEYQKHEFTLSEFNEYLKKANLPTIGPAMFLEITKLARRFWKAYRDAMVAHENYYATRREREHGRRAAVG